MAKGIALAVLFIIIVATYWRPLRSVRAALAIDYLVSTGHAFLVLGYLLGLIFGERSTPLATDLSPVVALVAGWVGFAVGMRFDRRVLRTIPIKAFAVALLPGAISAFVIAGGCGLLFWYSELDSDYTLAAALVVGAAAASSGPMLVAVLQRRRAGRSSHARPVLRMIEFSAGLDDLLVLLLGICAFSLFRANAEPIAPAWLLASAIGGGVLLGTVTWLFLGGSASEDERLLLGLAMLAFTSGFAGWLHLSPAGVSAIAGLVLVNLPGDRMSQLFEAVRRVERPAVVVLMTVIGFHASGSVTWLFWPLLAIMTLLRLVAKHRAGALISTKIFAAPGLRTCRDWGLGLAPQGIVGLMVTLSFFHIWQDEVSRTVLAAVAAASLVNEIAAPWFLLRLVKSIAPVRIRSEAPKELT